MSDESSLKLSICYTPLDGSGSSATVLTVTGASHINLYPEKLTKIKVLPSGRFMVPAYFYSDDLAKLVVFDNNPSGEVTSSKVYSGFDIYLEINSLSTANDICLVTIADNDQYSHIFFEETSLENGGLTVLAHFMFEFYLSFSELAYAESTYIVYSSVYLLRKSF